jgi:hypothetical protein
MAVESKQIQWLESQDSFEIYVGVFHEENSDGQWNLADIRTWAEDDTIDKIVESDMYSGAGEIMRWLDEQFHKGIISREDVEDSAGDRITRYWKG